MKRLVPYTNGQGEEVKAEIEMDADEAAAFDLSGALSLSAIKAVRITEAYAEMERRIEAAVISIETSAGTHFYGIDRDTQDNLAKVVLGVLLGLTPNPRPWTPKGEAAPIMVSHADLTVLAGTIGNAFDQMMQAYLTHKAAITACESADQAFSHNLATGWSY